MFFKADDGFHYPVAEIARWKSDYTSGRQALIVEMKSGERLEVAPHFAQTILYAGRDTLPAQIGTYFVGIINDEGRKSIYLKPIIGWLVRADSAPVPLTASGCEDGVTNDYAIMLPNGSVDRPEMDSYADLAGFVKDLQFSDQETDEGLRTARAALASSIT